MTCRFTADVTCLAVSGDLLAAGSADMTLKVGLDMITLEQPHPPVSCHIPLPPASCHILLPVQVVNTSTFSKTVLEGH